MEKSFSRFIKEKFKEYDNYDLYNYIAWDFSDDVESFDLNENEESLVNYLLDSVYDLDLEYYDNKNKLGNNEAFSILIEKIEKMKNKVIETLN